MGRKKVENGLTKDMIVEEADRQFLQIDFQKVSMRSIASALGFSHGSIYYHFQNKTDLFNAVIEKYFTILNNLLDSALKFDCLEGTKYVLTNYIQFGLDNQSQYDFMFVKYDGLNDPLQQIAPKERDRKSTRLNSSHVKISYAVFCLKKKKENNTTILGHNKLFGQRISLIPERKIRYNQTARRANHVSSDHT